MKLGCGTEAPEFIRPQYEQQRIPREMILVLTGIQGIVRNRAALYVGGARVVLYRADGTVVGQVTTKGDGIYRFLGVPAGEYQLQVEAQGFVTFRRENVEIPPTDVVDVDITLDENRVAPYARRVPLRPELGQPSPSEPAIAETPYRTYPIPQATELSAATASPEPLPSDENVFTGVPNRWTRDYPPYRRYGYAGEFPFVPGHWYDPFNRNKLKGDYPIFGNRTFLNLTATSDTFTEGRRLPTPSDVSTARPGSEAFFGRPGQFLTTENLAFSADLFHGDAAFRPVDWRVKVTADVNLNYLLVQENGVVSPDPRKGTTRFDDHASLHEAFGEVKLADLSNQFDFISARAGIQTFNSDFRGFIFSDQEPGFRLFGNLRSNRYQYNVAYFPMLEKDTNSGLNRFEYRHQQVFIANLYRQDFVKPGYTIQVSFHCDKDDPSLRYDENDFLVRPAPIGSVVSGGGVREHEIRAYYYGLTGDGHFRRLNLTHAFYQVLGHDSFNGIAGRKVDINAQMAAAELSLDKDWIRYRVSFFYASGDKNPRDGTATGFDAIFDDPNFGGGIFSFWNREGIRLTGTGVALESPDSLLASLRSSKIEGQANFVNPGLFLYNAGADIDITPKLRGFINLNLIRFARTEPLELVLFQQPIHAGVGADSGIGVRYRPPLTDNMIITAGVNAFQPFRGFADIYTGRLLWAGFVSVRFQF